MVGWISFELFCQSLHYCSPSDLIIFKFITLCVFFEILDSRLTRLCRLGPLATRKHGTYLNFATVTTFPSTYFFRTISYIPVHLMCIKVPVCFLLGTKKFLTLWVGHYPTHLYPDSDDPAQRRIRTLSRKAREVPTPCNARVAASTILVLIHLRLRITWRTNALILPRWMNASMKLQKDKKRQVKLVDRNSSTTNSQARNAKEKRG